MLPHQQCLHWRRTVLFHPAGGHEQSDSDQGGVVVGSHELLTARLDVSDVTQTELLLPRVVGEVTFSECVVVIYLFACFLLEAHRCCFGPYLFR